jgi:hypothetical protein
MDSHRPQDQATRTQLIDVAELDSVSLPTGAAHDRAEPVPGRREGDASGARAAALTIRRGPNAGHTFTLARDAVTVLGRDPGCGIVLAHVTVSRRHAEVRPTHAGFELTDTGSLNGSYLNREPVDSAPLSDGDEIQLGIFRLTFHAAQCRHER